MEFLPLLPYAQFSIMTDMENSTFSGHFREKSTRKSCVNFILSFWNPLYNTVAIISSFVYVMFYSIIKLDIPDTNTGYKLNTYWVGGLPPTLYSFCTKGHPDPAITSKIEGRHVYPHESCPFF